MKQNKPVTKRQILPDSTYRRYLQLSKPQGRTGEWWWPGAGGSGEWGSLFNECSVSVSQNEEGCGDGGGGGCTALLLI